jgi:hypothetical protein
MSPANLAKEAALAFEYEDRRCQKCGTATCGEEAYVDEQFWCHPCADALSDNDSKDRNMSALDIASLEIVAAGDKLSLMAQTSGGTAGRDNDLVAAIQNWQEAKSKFNQVVRIERFEPAPGIVISAGLGAGLPACAACGKQPSESCPNIFCAFIEPCTAAGSLD